MKIENMNYKDAKEYEQQFESGLDLDQKIEINSTIVSMSHSTLRSICFHNDVFRSGRVGEFCCTHPELKTSGVDEQGIKWSKSGVCSPTTCPLNGQD